MAGLAAARAMMAVLVLRLQRMFMAELFEAAIVLGFVGFDKRVDGVQSGVGGNGRKRQGQCNSGGQNVSHGGSPEQFDADRWKIGHGAWKVHQSRQGP